jgi:hypothetical protein
MALPFVSASMAALSAGNGPQGVWVFGKKVYCIDNDSGGTGTAQKLVIVDFSVSPPSVGSAISLAKGVGSSPRQNWCVDAAGNLWTSDVSGATNNIFSLSTSGTLLHTFTPGAGLTGPFCISPFTLSGTNYVAALYRNGSTGWDVVVINASTGAQVWDNALSAPGAIPGGGTYSTFSALTVDNFFIASDGTNIYQMFYHKMVSGVDVDDYVVYKMNPNTMATTILKFHSSSTAAGGGYAFLVDSVNAHLILYCSGGAIQVVNTSDGSQVNLYPGLTDTFANSFPNNLSLSYAMQGGADNTNNSFLAATPGVLNSVRRVKLSTFTSIDDNVAPDAWIGAGFTTESYQYAPFGPALVWTTTFYPTSGNYALLELLWGGSSACTVTGTMNRPDSSACASGCFVRFVLRGFTGRVPRNPNGIIAETVLDVSPDASGNISTTLWDNVSIDAATGGGVFTFYEISFHAYGRQTSVRNYRVSCAGSPFNLNTVIPIPPNTV